MTRSESSARSGRITPRHRSRRAPARACGGSSSWRSPRSPACCCWPARRTPSSIRSARSAPGSCGRPCSRTTPSGCDLIDRLKQPPELVVLGSSRALKAEPSVPAAADRADAGSTPPRRTARPRTASRTPTCSTTAGPTRGSGTCGSSRRRRSGRCRRARSCWPSRRWRSTSRRRCARARGSTTSSGCSSGARLKSSVKTAWRAARGVPPQGQVDLEPDGFRAVDQHDRSEQAGVSFQARLNESVGDGAGLRPVHGAARPRRPMPAAYFEQAVADMNRFGDEPVIVLGPVHPAYRAAMGGAAYDRLNDELTRYLDSLHGRPEVHGRRPARPGVVRRLRERVLRRDPPARRQHAQDARERGAGGRPCSSIAASSCSRSCRWC